MARYFAELDADSTVVRVVVCSDPVWLESRLGGTWVETADPYVEPGEVAYCGPGFGYDPDWPVRFARPWAEPQPVQDPEEGDDPWTWYHVGDVVSHGGVLWVSTMDENVWEPGLSAWRRTPTAPGVPPVWTEPTGAHDAWQVGEHVTHDDAIWVCVEGDSEGNNVWEPGVFGWEIVDG